MSNLNMAGRAGSPHQGQTGIISLCCLKLFLICFFFCLCDYFVWSQRPVLKSNLQAPTWLRLISHRLFITAITSPHVFLSSSSSTSAGQHFSLSLHLADLTSLPPSRLPLFDLQQPVQPILRSFPRTFPRFVLTFVISFRLVLIFPFPSVNAFILLLSLCNYKSASYIWAQRLSSVAATSRICIHTHQKADMIPGGTGCLGWQRWCKTDFWFTRDYCNCSKV